MPDFSYKAARKGGRTVTGTLTASSRAQAVRRLREDGLFPLELVETASTGDGGRRQSLFRPGHRASRESQAVAMRQLATLLRAGIPLDKALDAIIHHTGRQTGMQRIMAEVRETVRGGGDLASAFARFPRVFGDTFVTMVRAGESAGSLDVVLERLADHVARRVALRRKVQAALAYPVLMLIVGCGVVAFLLSFVVPQVTQIFFDMERTLPLVTRILIALSDGVRAYGLVLLAVLFAAAIGLYRFYATRRGRALFDRLVLATPVVGGLSRQLAVSRFSRTLGMLLKNGVSLISSLEIVGNVAGNTVMRSAVERVRQDVQEGKPLTGPLAASGLFEHTAVQMISAGEQAGRLDEMLLTVADDSEEKVEARLQMLSALMEPLMILALGCVVGFVVLAIMLPIFEMSTLVGG